MPKSMAVHELRIKALHLFAEGKPIDEVAQFLHSQHPGRSFDEVHRAYFPPRGGLYMIQLLEGKGKREIKAHIGRLNEYRSKQSKRATTRNTQPGARTAFVRRVQKAFEDPDVVARRNEAASETLKRLWEDPNFALMVAKRSSGIRKQQEQDPRFVAKRNAAVVKGVLERFSDPDYVAMHAERTSKRMLELWKNPDFARNISTKVRETMLRQNEERAQQHVMDAYDQVVAALPAEVSYGFEGEKKVVPIQNVDLDRVIVQRVMQSAIRDALKTLPPVHRYVVANHFGIDVGATAKTRSQAEALEEHEREKVLDEATRQLGRSRNLKKLAKEQ